MKHISWDYEEDATPPRYHVYTVSDDADLVLGDGGAILAITVPQSPEADALVRTLVGALDELIEMSKTAA